MGNMGTSRTLLLASLILLMLLPIASGASKSYIVYMGGPVAGRSPRYVAAFHQQKLSSVLGRELASKSILYSYSRLFNGFAAVIPPDKLEEVSKVPGVLRVMESGMRQLQTTRSWQFLNLRDIHGTLRNGLIQQANGGQNVVIGMVDTGIWPESESFDDSCYGPSPKNWRGSCVQTKDFNRSSCNKKIIGAKYYVKAYLAANGTMDNFTMFSPRDTNGHGTHTASTAAGSCVENASYRGFAKGTACGGPCGARLSIYKTCWPGGCADPDILKALDDGVKDGVDVFSISLSGPRPRPEPEDPLAVGSLYAVVHGISVVMAAGNPGHDPGLVVNTAPWIITVAASSIDRRFSSKVILGDQSSIEGESLSEYELIGSYPIVSATAVSKMNISDEFAPFCLEGALDPKKTRGKIVACQVGGNFVASKGTAVREAGGVGMVIYNDKSRGETTFALSYELPATYVGARAGSAILAYIYFTRNPTACLTRATTSTRNELAPEVAEFSARGPNVISPEIVKPDITAPGVNILAAYSKFMNDDSFKILSGTSMACPHVAGVVALLKSLHPDWSPAAIQSAIITTGRTTNNAGGLITDGYDCKAATPWHYGGGHIDPNAAADPGLVYDSSPDDYIACFCRKLDQLNASTAACPANFHTMELNYPSVSVTVKPGVPTRITRRIKSVMRNRCDFEAKVDIPESDISIVVTPSTLRFSHEDEEKAFKVEFVLYGGSSSREGATEMIEGFGRYSYGSLTWSGCAYHVRSPLIVKLER